MIINQQVGPDTQKIEGNYCVRCLSLLDRHGVCPNCEILLYLPSQPIKEKDQSGTLRESDPK